MWGGMKISIILLLVQACHSTVLIDPRMNCPAGHWAATNNYITFWCAKCTNSLPANNEYKYTFPAPVMNTCPYKCKPQFVKSGSACVCNYGITGYKENSISPCKLCTVCNATQYETLTCGSKVDRICMNCGTCPSGSYITGWCSKTQNIQCRSCTQNCPMGMYMSTHPSLCDGTTTFDIVGQGCAPCPTPNDCIPNKEYYNHTCYGNDTVRPTCSTCTDPDPYCDTGYQWMQSCTMTRNRICKNFDACPAGYYASLFNATSEVCLPCTPCVSMGLREITPCKIASDAVCGGRRCDSKEGCYANHNGGSVFCDYEHMECGLCPPGYGSFNLTCIDCPPGFSCDSNGIPVCQGECPFGFVPVCDSGLVLDGYAQCIPTTCSGVNMSNMIVTRGAYVNAKSTDCAPYFECVNGYYKQFNVLGTVTCQSCNTTSKPRYAMWVSNGLVDNSQTSCLWECNSIISYWDDHDQKCVLHNRSLVWNRAGWYGANIATCPLGFTTQQNHGWDVSSCLPCPPLPVYATWSNPTLCQWTCMTGVKMGSRCIQMSRVCDPSIPGLRRENGMCTESPFPWQQAGHFKGGLNLRYTGEMGRPPTIQNGVICSQVFSEILGESYVFLAWCNKSFISYRKLSDPHQYSWTLIGNSTRGWNEGFKTEALFQNELFLANGINNQTIYVIDRWNCLLREITIDYPGSYLTQSFTVYGQTNNLMISGSPTCYGTNGLSHPRDFQIGQDNYLFFFDDLHLYQLNMITNRVQVVLNMESTGVPYGSSTAFMYNKWALNVLGYEVTAISERCAMETTSLQGGECIITCPWLDDIGTPIRYVDPHTGACMPCINPRCNVGFKLMACTPTSQAQCEPCPFLEPLNNKYNRTYMDPGLCDDTSVGFVPPCPKGFYEDNNICTECPDFSTTLADEATQVAMCVCVEGMTMILGKCYTGKNGREDSLYPLLEKNTCGFARYFRDANSGCTSCHVTPCTQCEIGNYSTLDCTCRPCDTPTHAHATSRGLLTGVETSCDWQCDAGLYPSSIRRFKERCQPCTNIQPGYHAVTQGALDAPSSCVVIKSS